MKRYESIRQKFEELISDIPVEKGKMHKVLGLSPDEDITKKYTSGEKLAKDLVAKVGKKSATGMLAYAANLQPQTNVFDAALKALKNV